MATEDNADEFYKPYFYATEDNADLFYAPYLGANIRADEERETYDADSYYLPYYADQMSDPWLQFYGPLPTHSKDHPYQGPTTDLQELPKLSQGFQISGPKYELIHEIAQESDNEIFDVPKIFLKSMYNWVIELSHYCKIMINILIK